MAGLGRRIKNLLFFKEPKKTEEFILRETPEEQRKNYPEETSPEADVPRKEKTVDMSPEKTQGDKKGKEEKTKKSEISPYLSENLAYIKKVYRIPTNGDIILREFAVTVKDRTIPAFFVAIDGMVDRKVIDDNILEPLMLLSNLDIKGDAASLSGYIRDHLMPHNQLKVATEYAKIISEINFGGCAVFIDGVDAAFTADVKGFEHRGVERPNTEMVIRGPQEGFNEILRTNTALIRKRLKDEDLIVENIEIGRRSKTPCSLLYIKDIANDSLVDEVRRRLKSIKVDYIFDTGELEQLIEDNTYLPAPQVIATERPDRAASMLADGRVAVVLNGSPFALVMPITNNDLIHSPEDTYVRFPYSNLLRFIRILAVFLSLLLPGAYLAITNFHQEMIPTDLLLAIEASREKVPFPSIVEILIMEISFELIREAGIRIPGPIGPTLGIIGALILGQAAVAANIVSPILIIIVAVTGIGSFAIPNFSLAFAFRILRFGFIILGALSGLLGITTGMFILGIWFTGAKSFGVPYVSPFAPKMLGGLVNEFFRAPLWQHEMRPDYLNTKDDRKQPDISRGWTAKSGKEDGNGK